MRTRRFTADTADRDDLYEKSVQDPKPDIELLTRHFRSERGRVPLTLREDFCGTAFFSAEWIASRRDRSAIGVDNDAGVIARAKRRHFEPGSRQMRFLRGNVVTAKTAPVDLVCAFNFSWSVFHQRETLLRYFRRARSGLKRDGLFALDLHGGPDSLAPMKDERRMGGFTYVWEQEPLDPLSHRTVRRIHFEFPDGSSLRNVFRYDWRVWTIPETREALLEAGFRRVDVLWELFDAKGEGSGIFKKVQRATNEDSWVAYLLAWR